MAEHHFAICIENTDYEASLELRKLYEIVVDVDAAERGLMRVLDESGEDYLYPTAYFVPIHLPTETVDRIFDTA